MTQNMDIGVICVPQQVVPCEVVGDRNMLANLVVNLEPGDEHDLVHVTKATIPHTISLVTTKVVKATSILNLFKMV